jgi:hypothetical protein
MKKVSGFLTNDGSFFPSEDEARLYDAMAALTFAVTNVGANPKAVFVILDGCAAQVMEYLNAKQAHQEAETANPRSPGALGPVAATSSSLDYTDGRGAREGDSTPVFQQSPDSYEHVPDVGSGEQPEEIPNFGSLNGPGIRSRDARSVRSDPPVATGDTTRATWPRTGEGA